MLEKSVRIGLILLLGTMLIPHAVHGVDCNLPEYNYTLCLKGGSDTACACCVVTKDCDLGSSCCDAETISNCTKPIGVLMHDTHTTLTNTLGIPIVYTSEPGACNVGIMVNKYEHGAINHIKLYNMTVRNWANGILIIKTQADSGVWNSNITGNTNGIYLFNAQYINLSSNFITGNDIGIYLDNQSSVIPTSNNTIFNNYLNNTVNAAFWQPARNVWNTTNSSGRNILGDWGGNRLGGNYWGGLDGFSESSGCNCKENGLCHNPYYLTTPPSSDNVDWLPLCHYAPSELFFDVRDRYSGLTWELFPGRLRENYRIDAYNVTIKSGKSWDLTISSDPADGKMNTSSTPVRQLSNVLQVGNHTIPQWFDVTSTSPIRSGSGDSTFNLSLKQVVDWVDTARSDYSITLYFTITER